MARARLISTSLGSSRRFCRLHNDGSDLAEFAQLLFVLLVVNCDDFGRTEADPFTVKLKVFPGSPRTEEEFETALQTLAQVGLIQLYNGEEGDRYLAIEKFEEHQTGLHKRTQSRFPIPPLSGKFREIPGSEKLSEENKGELGNSGKFREFPSEQNMKGTEHETKGTERKGGSRVVGPLIRAIASTAEQDPERCGDRVFRRLERCADQLCELEPELDRLEIAAMVIEFGPWHQARNSKNPTPAIEWIPDKWGAFKVWRLNGGDQRDDSKGRRQTAGERDFENRRQSEVLLSRGRKRTDS
jgi:hypothetical protein